MDYLVDTLTRAPSQVLVKSATQFGEEAAKVLGGHLEETIKTVSDDVNETIQTTAKDFSSELAATVTGFQSTFKETGVEAFSEWGIAIERAFLHLGQKLEAGISNAGNRMSNGVRDSITDVCGQMNMSVGTGFDRATRVVETFGLEHAGHYKRVYYRELTGLLVGFLIIACSALLFSVAYFVRALVGEDAHGGASRIMSFTQLTNVAAFVTFAMLNGYVIYSWNKSVDVGASGPGGSESERRVDGNEEQEGPHDSVEVNSTPSSPTSPHSQVLSNPKMLFIVVGASGFVAGQIVRNLFHVTSFRNTGNLLNMFVSLVIMVLLTLFMYKIFTFDLFYKLYVLKRDIAAFLEWRRQHGHDLEEASSTSSSTSTTSSPSSIPIPNSAREKQRKARRRKKHRP